MTFEELKTSCLNCRDCELAKTRTNVVFGYGNEKSKIILIGEGPGQVEDETGKPFVGRSGKLLDLMLDAIDLSREKNVYIANTVKCRPPGNRDPLPNETETCKKYLDKQMELIAPKIVICLGRISAFRMIKPDFRVTVEHGQWFERDGVFYMGTFHPAALLRNVNQKPMAFDDFMNVKAKIEELGIEI